MHAAPARQLPRHLDELIGGNVLVVREIQQRHAESVFDGRKHDESFPVSK